MIDVTMLKNIREDNDLKQNQMADILHVKRSAYSLWELGINIIPLQKLITFADYFNYSLDYTLGLTKNKDSDHIIKGLDLKVLGENLRKIRLEHNLTQKEIAKILNVEQACITKYEKGNICISTSNLYKYSKKFKIPIAKLCGKVKSENKELQEINN